MDISIIEIWFSGDLSDEEELVEGSCFFSFCGGMNSCICVSISGANSSYMVIG